MKTLNDIVNHKKHEVEMRKQLYPIRLLETSIYFETKPVSLKKYLQRKDKSGIIAEFKKQSPSLGVINKYADIEKTSIEYMQSGASALSVLTDSKFFGGSENDLKTARKFNYCPILRKDFIVDEYQIIESKSLGADVVLLIASVLTAEEIKSFSLLAQQLGMEVILELHDLDEVKKLFHATDIVGVNNRNLKTMEVNIHRSLQIAPELPVEMLKISESGIEKPESIVMLKNHGFKGFLIGSYFMRQSKPHEACRELIHKLNKISE